MKERIMQVWSELRLLNWVALFFLFLIVSIPARQCFAADNDFLIEQLEQSDGEPEQESEEKTDKIDGEDEFLFELHATYTQSNQISLDKQPEPGLFQQTHQTIFDPPPEQ